MNKENNFELGILLNKRLLRNFYSYQFSPVEERETQTEEKRERWLKEKILRIKENVLYNNLDSQYLSSLNLNLSNIFYFKNFLKISNDFESIDFDHVQKMRMNYLKSFFNYLPKDEAKNVLSCYCPTTETIRKNEKLFLQFLEDNLLKHKQDDLIPLISSLISVLLTDNFDEKIILRLLDNILLSTAKSYVNDSYENSSEIEKNLLLLFETLEKRIFSNGDENVASIDFIVHVLHKILLISLNFQSFPLFFLYLYKCKELKISIDNYKVILEKFFKPKMDNVLSFKETKENIFQSFEFSSINSEVKLFSFTSDESFIYIALLLLNEKDSNDVVINLFKIGSGFNQTLLNKIYLEKSLAVNVLDNAGNTGNINNFSNCDCVRFINNEDKNELLLVLSSNKEENKIKTGNLRLININKDNFNVVQQGKVFIKEIISVFNTEKNVFTVTSSPSEEKLNSSSGMIEEDNSNTNAISIEIHKICINNPTKIEKVGNFKNILDEVGFELPKKEQTYQNFFNNKIFFINPTSQISITIKLPNFKIEKTSGKEVPKANGYFYNKFHNYNILANFKDNKILFEYYLNKDSSPFAQIKEFRKAIKNSKKVIKNKYEGNTDKESINKIKNVTNFLLKKIQLNNTNNTNTSLSTPILFTHNEKSLSDSYFSLLLSYLTKYITVFGNLKNSFKRYLDYDKNPLAYQAVYLKSLHNNISQEVFDLIFIKALTNASGDELLSNLIFIKAFLINILDINVDLNLYLSENLTKVFDFIFNLVLSFNTSLEKSADKRILSEAIFILELILKNSSVVKDNPSYINKLIEVATQTDKDFISNIETKVIYLNIILSYYDKTKIDLNLVEHVVKFELELINEIAKRNLNNSHFDDLLPAFEFIRKFKKNFFNSFLSQFCEWDIKEENKINENENNSNSKNIITQIFNLVIEKLQILIKNENINSRSIVQYLNTYSFITHVTLFYINIFITKSELETNSIYPLSYIIEQFPFKYFEKVINLIIQLDENFKSKIDDNSSFNNLKEKIYFFESEHPCENDMKRTITFKFNNNNISNEEKDIMNDGDELVNTNLNINKNAQTTSNLNSSINNPISFKFDSMSQMNSDSKLLFDLENKITSNSNIGCFNTNFPTEEKKILNPNNEAITLLMKYEPSGVPKENAAGYNYSYGFSFKCMNTSSNEDEYNIISDLRRSLIYSICKLIHNCLINNKSLKDKMKTQSGEIFKPEVIKKEANLYKALFSSKLLENISIVKMTNREFYKGLNYKNYIHNDYYKDIEVVINSINDESIKEKCLTYLNSNNIGNDNYNTISTSESDEVNIIIESIIKNEDEFYKKGITLLHKFFLSKNLWGNTGGKEIEHLVIFLFVIILKHEKLIFRYKEFLNLINSDKKFDCINTGNIKEILNFDFFLKVFTECSKIRIWFNEKKMHIAETIVNNASLLTGTNEKLTYIQNENLDAQIDLEISNYIIKISQKAEFLLEALNITNDPIDSSSNNENSSSSPRHKIKEFSTHLQDLINNLLVYIKTDEVQIDKIVDKISLQNEKANNKETALICFNILLTLVQTNQQDLRDILYWMNLIFKSDIESHMSNLVYFNKDLFGADSAYIERVKIQFYNFISLLLEKVFLKVNHKFALEKSHFDNLTHLIIAQSLIWKIKKRDYLFIRNSRFFDIFKKDSVFANILSHKNQNKICSDESNSCDAVEECQYGKECIDFTSLQDALYQLLVIYSLQFFDKLNDEIVINKTITLSTGVTQIISPRTATTLLAAMRKRSEFNEFESFNIIDKISDVILNEFEDYLNCMRDLIADHSRNSSTSQIPNEEKLNSYLSLLYRGFSYNNNLIIHFMQRNSDFLAVLLEIFLITSDKNKYFIIKFIKMFTYFSFDEDFFNTSIDVFRFSLGRRFPDFYFYINGCDENKIKSKSENKIKIEIENDDKSSLLSNFEFYIHFLIKLTISLLNNTTDSENKNQFFFSSESDKEIAWELICYLRTLLCSESKSNSPLKEEIIKYIKETATKEISTNNFFTYTEKNILLIILGADFNPIRIGSKVYIDVNLSEKKKNELKNIHEFLQSDYPHSQSFEDHFIFAQQSTSNISNAAKENQDKKIGVILGFTQNAKNPFIIEETISEFSFDPFSYSPIKKYALVVLEENLTRENVKTLAYDTMILETMSLDLVDENVYSDVNATSSSGKLHHIILDNNTLEVLINNILTINVLEDNTLSDTPKSDHQINSLKHLYLEFKLLKNILFSEDALLIKRFDEIVLKQNLYEKLIKIFTSYSLSALSRKINQTTLEKLEKKSIKEILIETHTSGTTYPDTDHKKSQTITPSTNPNISPESSPSLSLSPDYNSLFIKFNNNLIREIPFLKLFFTNNLLSHTIRKNFYYNIIRYTNPDSILHNKTPSVVLIDTNDLTKDLLSILEENKIVLLVTNEQLINKKDLLDSLLTPTLKLPIICISDIDFSSTTSFLFDQIPNEDFEELFLQSIQRDFSSFIDIPPMMIDESVRFGQRDLVLKILNEENVEKSTKESSIAQFDISDYNSITKLIALISRRILLFLLSKFANKTKPFMEIGKLLKIVKLLIFENNLTNIEAQSKSISTANEIVALLKSLINSINTCDVITSEFDNKLATSLLDLSFINKVNYIDYNLIANVDSEEALLSFENIENNLKIIFATLKVLKRGNERNLNMSTSLTRDYEMKLFHALILKLDDFMIKNKETGAFLLDVLIILLGQIYDSVADEENPTMRNTIKNYTFLFRSEEFLSIASRVKEIFDKKDPNEFKIDQIESKIINFFIIFLDLALLVFTRFDLDLNMDYFINSKIMNLYFAYSLLTKKFKNLEFFILFCQMRDIVSIKSSKRLKNCMTYDFHFRDKNYETPHLMKFAFDMADGVNVRIKSKSKTNPTLDIDPNSLIFIYNDKDCSRYSLQDYFNLEDNNKEIFIKNKSGNQFFVSFPYKEFSHNLFGSGSNENQSLGCNGETGKYYGVPQRAAGILSRNVKSFKFGYYHCFVATTDDKLYVCGKDTASSLKESREYPSYTLDNYFNEIVSREGLSNVWVNNYNATILLTKTNKVFGCGVNTDGCLSSKTQINNSTNIPFELTPFTSKVKFVACGFKTSMLVLDDGSALTVGCNTYNETGNMSHTSIEREYFHLYPPEGSRIVDAVSGEHFFLLLIEEKNGKVRLYSIGCNENGRCGVDTDNSHKLQKCKGVENLEFRLIASRNLSSAAVTKTGLLYTFGSNENANLGLDSSGIDHRRPTLVEALKDYIVDDVSISHNHMLVVARDRVRGLKYLFGSGTNQYGSLCFEDLSIRAKIPKEILFFKEKEKTLVPVKLATSRYQSYILALESKISEDRCFFNLECKACNAHIDGRMFIRPVRTSGHGDNMGENKMITTISNEASPLHLEFFCDHCLSTKIGSEIVYMINTPTKYIKNLTNDLLPISKDLIQILSQTDTSITNPVLYLDSNTFQHSETNQQFSYQCIDCFTPINNTVFISTENPKLILCSDCIANCSTKIEYPQVFYTMNKIRIDNTVIRSKLPMIPNLSIILYNIEKTAEPYFSLEITPVLSQLEELLVISKEKTLFEQFAKWRRMNNNFLVELNNLKDEIDTLAKEGSKNNINVISTSENNKLMQFLSATEEGKYKLLKSIDHEEFNLLNELSGSINECIFYLMNLTYNIKEKGFMHQAITDNLSLVSSKARLNIFHERIGKLKINVNPNEKEMHLNRMKAMKFYEKKVLDTTGENTIFGQMYNKMKKFPLTNYLCKKDNRLFVVNLTGEGATDYGGPYREVLSTACEELHSVYLELFIKSPNNRNEVGAFRDKYICNPSAKSALLIDMFFFVGCLIGYAISSGQLLNLNIHPLIWKLILNHQVDFAEFESIDKLFYKYINDIDKFASNDKALFTSSYEEFFLIQLSDGSELELMPNGRKTQVTLENKDKFVSLAKAARLNEFKVQVESIRYGLINVIPDNILSILTGKEVEELACGEPTLNIEILKKYTEYQNYRATDPIIVNFWKALDSFPNEDKVMYLKYVWGRSRLPDPNIFPFTHVIAKMSHSYPDTRLPSATTCYFTLKLPAYSSYEALAHKLKYVIQNCSEIDADFAVTTTVDM